MKFPMKTKEINHQVIWILDFDAYFSLDGWKEKEFSLEVNDEEIEEHQPLSVEQMLAALSLNRFFLFSSHLQLILKAYARINMSSSFPLEQITTSSGIKLKLNFIQWKGMNSFSKLIAQHSIENPLSRIDVSNFLSCYHHCKINLIRFINELGEVNVANYVQDLIKQKEFDEFLQGLNKFEDTQPIQDFLKNNDTSFKADYNRLQFANPSLTPLKREVTPRSKFHSFISGRKLS